MDAWINSQPFWWQVLFSIALTLTILRVFITLYKLWDKIDSWLDKR